MPEGLSPAEVGKEIAELSKFARPQDRSYEEAELDSRDKGFVYGMALALAQEDDPSAATEEINQRAWYAAEAVWSKWTSPPLRQDLDRWNAMNWEAAGARVAA